jgi:histone-lysine N-methyltransferase SETD3
VTRDGEEDAFARLVRWIEEGGGSVAPITLSRDATGRRGVHARAPIAPDQRVFEIPQSHLITQHVAEVSEIGLRIRRSGVQPRSHHTWFAAYLLQEKHAEDSFWRPYLDLLPESYAHVPILFEPEDLAHLRGSFTVERIEKRKEALAHEYHRLVDGVAGFHAFGYEEFLWARIAVATRLFSMKIDGEATEGLVPLADLLNHARPRETSWGFDDGVFAVTALGGFAPGQEIPDSYGPKCNGRYFVSYGFALRDNPDNLARIRIPLPSGDRFCELAASYAAVETRDAFALLRRASQALCGASPASALGAAAPIDAANEEASLSMLESACREALAAFDTTIEEDDASLTTDALSANARLCVVMRRGEKLVLRALLELARDAVPLLRLPPGEARRAARERHQVGGPFEDYLAQVVPDIPLKARSSSIP